MAVPKRKCGAIFVECDRARWRVWAPKCRHLQLLLDDSPPQEMTPTSHGWFEHEAAARAGTRYAFLLDGKTRADPCSLSQPDGPAGKSALFNPALFPWHDAGWQGIPRQDLVFYELHVGTFTPEGTFQAIIPRLQSLRDLGITAIELMPIAQFSGNRNWGYDAVLPYAAQNSYGGPLGLQKLIDAAHAMGLAVFLDVVYNHMGPEHNYLDDFGPYFTDNYKTPWGRAINFDGPGSDPVREFVLSNVRMWLEEFHADGLRLDAVHAIYDFGAHHILAQIKETAAEVAARTRRDIHIVAESDLNDPRIVLPAERGGHALDAQWSDDFHHALHVLLTGERRGYYADFQGAPDLPKILQSPFLFAGTYSQTRQRTHGLPPRGIPGDHFVVCTQNHDQVGNRAVGDRLTTQLNSPEKLRLAACLLLLSPYLPLLFMGEEYGETSPFPFFCSFESPDLIQAVRQGRKREFADFAEGSDLPDPQSESTFHSAQLT
ncbi:MAG TPA: malto-oligosyltrehalose trehalohydrolase, partial [Phycisphaerae bacterium]|nr:malto-oligosyltrehalose trehalohydrolase [Phycisphaerae bacterium]